MKSDITPNPQGANPIFERLFEGMRSQGLLPPPLFPVVEIPEDRSDATRDAASTGV